MRERGGVRLQLAGFLAIFPESGFVSHLVKAAIFSPVLAVGECSKDFTATLRI